MSDPLNILLTNSGRKWIGEVGHCALLIESMEKLGHKFWAACRRGSEFEGYLERHNLRHLTLEFSSRPARSDLTDIRLLRELIDREGVDVVHVHRGKDHWIAMIAARRAGVPVVRTRHVVTPVNAHPLNRWLYARATDAVIGVSEAAEASLGRLAEKVPYARVIHSAVDQEKFSPARRRDLWRLRHVAPALAGEPLWIGLVGRVQKVKGQKPFLEAAGAVASECPEAYFLLAGRGAPKRIPDYENTAREKGFAGRLHVEGVLKNLPEVMASLDIGVIPSLGSEGSSRIALEMMASGVPIVASWVGGIPELLGAGPDQFGELREASAGGSNPWVEAEAGLLVLPGDAPALARAILHLARDPNARKSLAERGLKRVRSRYTLDLWSSSIEHVYRHVVEARGQALAG